MAIEIENKSKPRAAAKPPLRKRGYKTMLNVLKRRLIDGLEIVEVKETNTKYKIKFAYEGDKATAELPKACLPKCHNEVADYTIKTAMSTIYFNRGDYAKAKEWLDKKIAE